MLEIAAGIILAVVILVFWRQLFVLAGPVLIIGFILLIVVLGFYLVSN